MARMIDFARLKTENEIAQRSEISF